MKQYDPTGNTEQLKQLGGSMLGARRSIELCSKLCVQNIDNPKQIAEIWADLTTR